MTTLQRYNRDAYRVLDGNGDVAAMMLRLVNGKWGVYPTLFRATQQVLYSESFQMRTCRLISANMVRSDACLNR